MDDCPLPSAKLWQRTANNGEGTSLTSHHCLQLSATEAAYSAVNLLRSVGTARLQLLAGHAVVEI